MDEMKSCPFCGEPILTVAIKCKHCGSDLSQQAVIATSAPTRVQADYGIALLAIPVVATLLIWFWVGGMALIQGPGTILDLLIFVTAITTAVIVAMEAKKIGMVADRKAGTYTPTQWFFLLWLLWLVAYPVYFFKRKKYGLPNQGILATIVAIVFAASIGIMHSAISEQQEKIQKGMQELQDSIKPLGQAGEEVENAKIEMGGSSSGTVNHTDASLQTSPFTAAGNAMPQQEITVEQSGICKGLDTAITDQQMECLDRQYKQIDGELNQTYKSLYGGLDQNQKDKLKSEQVAWINYKEKACTNAGKEFEGGTMEAVLIKDCQVQKTMGRVKYLKSYRP
jgi:uncharacterized protein YecT (DUF1311 family)